ncbi:Major facilitator superfamily domain [Phytophthora cactorum]|nr:Major facilitator superfamily domain [Phytophthora cactorum]
MAETVLSPRKRLPRLNVDGPSLQDDERDVALSIAPSSPSTASTSSTADASSLTVVNAKAKTQSPPYEQSRLHERATSRLVAKIDEASDERVSDVSDESVDGLSRLQQLRNWVRRLRQTFGTSFLLLVSTVYAVQGFTSFSALAVNYFFKDNLQLQPAESQSLLTVMMVPWGIKPLYGIISDSLPLFGYHRKSYMMLCSAMGAIATLTLAVPDLITTPVGAVLVLMLNSLSTAVIDVVIDARVVEMSRLDPKYGANDLQSVSWVSMSVGGVLGSFLSGPATHNLGVRGVFCFAAVGPLTILIFSSLMHEAKTTVSKRHWKTSAKRQLRQLKGAICTPVIWMCALWVFLSGAISPDTPNVSEFWGALVCAWLGIAKDEYDMLWLAIILRSVLKVVPIFFLFLIPATDPQEIVDELDFSSPVQGDADKDENEEAEGDDEHSGTIREDHTVNDCSPTEEEELKGTTNAVV